ncbi:MAG: hypothetical protein QOE55_4663 [Acidobacteriaceae bacterium]|jgi:hypothetical protein|nr:hypothetical protein [Acidobacteriaceae bacterium]
MPDMPLGIAARECLAATAFLFEIDHHLGTGNLGAGINRIYVRDDKIRSLCLRSADLIRLLQQIRSRLSFEKGSAQLRMS